ncbi:MAG: LysM peptidoglycan-binding domain-containing protein [Chloroflexi bacterium]|nr:LysM peptidoglycan-binding domain-containing protein [Chloroflexota bacterium]
MDSHHRQAGDTLESLAARYRIGSDQLKSANCLAVDSLIPGTALFVPPAPTSTVAACIPGAVGWVKSYVVKAGDTLYSIATNHYTTVATLRGVNCKTSDRIYPGETLWVPRVATRTPVPTPLPGSTVTPHPTDPLTETALPFTATIEPSATSVPNTPTTAPTPTAVPDSNGKSDPIPHSLTRTSPNQKGFNHKGHDGAQRKTLIPLRVLCLH